MIESRFCWWNGIKVTPVTGPPPPARAKGEGTRCHDGLTSGALRDIIEAIIAIHLSNNNAERHGLLSAIWEKL
jgi:hypothetical protein